MKGLKIILSIAVVFAAAFIFFPRTAHAKFYCPLGYSYNAKIQLCVGKKSLKGYDALPSTKINVYKGKNHEYICPDKYAYSKKIQLCKGEGSLNGNTAQPTVRELKSASKNKK